MGFLIVPSAVVQTIFSKFWLVAGLVGSLILGKGIAAAVTGRAFGYARPARLTMWALTLPQVAATRLRHSQCRRGAAADRGNLQLGAGAAGRYLGS